MDQSSLTAQELNEQYIQEYYESGMFDHLQSPERFANLMLNRHWVHTEFYNHGITGLEQWYGDKASRKYEHWFIFMDRMLAVSESLFNSRLVKDQ